MKVEELPGQWVWVEAGMPILYRSTQGPAEVQRDRIVRIERMEPATPTQPAVAIWSDTEGSHGVAADMVRRKVVSQPPSGHSPVLTGYEAIASRLKPSSGR